MLTRDYMQGPDHRSSTEMEVVTLSSQTHLGGMGNNYTIYQQILKYAKFHLCIGRINRKIEDKFS